MRCKVARPVRGWGPGEISRAYTTRLNQVSNENIFTRFIAVSLVLGRVSGHQSLLFLLVPFFGL